MAGNLASDIVTIVRQEKAFIVSVATAVIFAVSAAATSKASTLSATTGSTI